MILLGATAAQALLGSDFRVTRQRGECIQSDLAPYVMTTLHPSSVLRQRSDKDRREAFDFFVIDLRGAAERPDS